MAIALVANRQNLVATTTTTTTNIPILNANLITTGNTLFMIVGAPNNASLVPAIPAGAVVTDPRGNQWVNEGSLNTGDGTASHGGMLQIYRTLVVAPYTAGDSLNIATTTAAVSAGFEIFEFSGVSQGPHSLFSAANKGVSATTAAGLPITVTAAGQLVIIAGWAGTTNTVTSDTDTLDGTWTGAFLRTVAGSGFGQWESHKILTGFTSGTQTYNATWTTSGGDNNYGQIALVFDPSSPQGFPFTQQFPPQDNPNYPFPDAGFEPMPTGSAVIPIDTGTAYTIEHTVPNYSWGTHFYSAVAQYDATSTAIQQHHIAYDLYQKGAELPQDSVTQVTFPIGAVNLGGGATVQGGGSALAALQSVGGSYIKMDTAAGNHFVECQFDLFPGTSGNGNPTGPQVTDYFNSRIIRMGVRFVGWKDDSSTLAIPVGEGLQFVYENTISNGFAGLNTYEVELGNWLIPDYQRSAVQQLRWIGEVNPMPTFPNAPAYYGASTGPGLTGTWFHAPPVAGTSWSYGDLLTFGSSGGFNFLKIYGTPGADFSQTLTYIDYLELVVEFAPERRLGNVTHSMATSPQYSYALTGPSAYNPGRGSVVPLFSTVNQAAPLTVTGSPNDYVLVAREALPASSSDYYPALATAPGAPAIGGVIPSAPLKGIQFYSPMEAVGPSLNLLGYTIPRNMVPNQRPLVVRAVVDGVFADTGTLIDSYVPSLGAADGGNYLSTGTFFPVFQAEAPNSQLKVWASNSPVQNFYTLSSSTFSAVRVVCKPDPLTTANLTVTFTGATTVVATITVANALAGEALGNGWFAVKVPVNVTTGSSGVTVATFTSTTGFGAPWFVSAVQSVGNSATTTFEPLAGNGQYAYAVELEAFLASLFVVTGTVSVSVSPTNHNTCLSSTMTVPSLTLTNGASYDRMIIERSVGSAGPWTVIGRLVAVANNQRFLDYEVPWDIGGFDASTVINYRVTGYRDSDRQSVSAVGSVAGTFGNPGAAFGLASNQLGVIMLYAPQDAGDLQVKWNALNPVQMIPQHMRDYQYALRIPENRGLSTTLDVEVNQFAACLIPTSSTYAAYVSEMLTYYGETIGSGRYAMTPRPYEVSLLPVFDSTYAWTLKLPGGHVRRVTVEALGDMTITTINGLYMASMTLTDTIALSSDPYDGS